MPDTETLHKRVVEALKKVIDPETGTDVMRMRLVLDLKIHEDGTAEYVFRPSSPLCPIALTLVMQIIEAVKSVEGINEQRVTVVDYTGAEELNAILATLPLS
ncbi:MAG: iron-sulfur cluster assembly protein, partial [Chloroflexota bacterium]|nr:iron-sulfur cluster assembly protein [Chloroflexota bacterium]